MPYILLLPWTGWLIHVYIITMYVNSRTDNIHIAFEHLCCFLHPHALLYIIPSFMNKLLSYIQFIKIYIGSNVVAAFWEDSNEKCEWKSIFTFPSLLTLLCFYRYTHRYLLVWRDYGWSQIPLTGFLFQIMCSMLLHIHVLSQQYYFQPKTILFLNFCSHVFLITHNNILWYAYFFNIGW